MHQRRFLKPVATRRPILRRVVAALVVAIAAFVSVPPAYAAEPRTLTFESADAGVKALVDALRRHDRKALTAIFGRAGSKMLDSGDAVADRQAAETFVAGYDQKHDLTVSGLDRATLTIGNDAWPFPVPLVVQNGKWVFDTRAGLDEILTRRIGRNELSAMQAVLAYGDAQREYAAKDRDGDGLRQYAQRFVSTPGKHDGLHWDVAVGEEQSPMGPLVASARREGYGGGKAAAQTRPYHGYVFRILTAQGPNAPGGAYTYIAKGKMIGGFGVVAYPAAYGSSGIMTFTMNHDGVLYEKDLGPDTAKAVARITRFDPDASWKRADPPG